jgi:beta-1,4-mannosyl-glycoprotein beta-1,4-N-acetylglucosaminyltransferase
MVIDAFTFFNELNLLDVRLHEHDSFVDLFVIVEALETFSGRPKRAVLRDNWSVVQDFKHKIIYTVLDGLEPPFIPETIWKREYYQRDYLMRSILEVATANDIAMISDCDELIRASVAKESMPGFSQDLHTIEHDLFYYRPQVHMGKWKGMVVGPVHKIIAAGGPQAVRDANNKYPLIQDGGWHFSYFGDAEEVRLKLKSFAHACDPPIEDVAQRSYESIASDMAAGRDLLRRPEVVSDFWDIGDYRLPSYMGKWT